MILRSSNLKNLKLKIFSISRTLVVFLLFNILILSCGQRSTPVEDSIQDQVLYLGNGTEPQDLAPHIVTGVPEHKVLLSLLEGLVVSHPEGKGYLPGVAKKWEISDDGNEYLFYLNENAKWSNGARVTAEDFVYSWKRILLPTTAAQYAYMLYVLENAEDFIGLDGIVFSDEDEIKF